jgi:hypothetical protein
MTMTAEPDTESRLARALTDGLEPKNWIAVVSVALGWRTDGLAGIG